MEQFPPSSPVLNASHSDAFTKETFHKEPYSKDSFSWDSRGRSTEYPTPNPSSSIGRLSSPARLGEEEVKRSERLLESSKKKDSTVSLKSFRTSTKLQNVQINKDFDIGNPCKGVLRVPLLASRPVFTIGRSSKASDYYLRSMQEEGVPIDKTVSRRHVQVENRDSSIVFTCLGHNGFMMMVPRLCGVTQKGEKNAYVLVEMNKSLENTVSSKTIRLDNNCTEFYVSRNESIEMPRIANVLLQIRNHIVLVNPEDIDDECTDDEIAPEARDVESAPSEGTQKQKPSRSSFMDSQATDGPKNMNRKEILIPQTTLPSFPKMPSELVGQSPVEDSVGDSTPSIGKSKRADMSKEDEDKENIPEEHKCFMTCCPISRADPINRTITPLANKSTNLPKNMPTKKRAASEEPVTQKKLKKEAEHGIDGKLIISQEWIKGLTNVQEIENILVNHLAFSRLSSTPVLVLNTILASLAKLSLKQLRTVLHNTSCIGVIYRQGKDAAGKPLEEEYFYEPEKDDDSQRILLLLLIKGHGGLRACRKTHKQYYWKKPAAKK